MSFSSVDEVETRLTANSAPLSSEEIHELYPWMQHLSRGAERRLGAELALQNLDAIRRFDKSSGKVAWWSMALNIVLLVLTIIALYIAVKSYWSAEESSKEQQKELDASRTALESVVATATKQQGVLEQSLLTSKAQLKILQDQWDREVRRQSQKPKLEFSLGEIPAKQLSKLQPIQVSLSKDRTLAMTFFVKNIGDAPVVHPTYMCAATNGVQIEPSQETGITVSDILPFNRSKKSYRADRTATVPGGVESFRVRLEIWGDNMDNSSVEVYLRIVPAKFP